MDKTWFLVQPIGIADYLLVLSGKNYYSLQPGGMQSIKELWNNQHNEHDTLESKNQVDNNLDYLSYSLLSQRHNSFFSN